MTETISANWALTADGWLEKAAVEVDSRGIISAIGQEGFDPSQAVGLLLPGVANCHTHSFQRAMAGLAERRAPGGDQTDDFWSWREVMYRFLEILTPEDIEAIAAQVQMDMAEAGFTSCAEFHYVHHQPGGARYDDLAETSARIMAASRSTGLGLTHLPVLYSRGGLDGRSLEGGQLRFGFDPDAFAELHTAITEHGRSMPDDFRLGVAPHSLRAVDAEGLKVCAALAPSGPLHIHAAEQTAEVDEVMAHLGARPVRWLLDNAGVDARWCLIHATHMDEGEIAGLAASGAVAGLCPTTEANLGDGVFPAAPYLKQAGRIAVGSDSNVRISLVEELRMLELSQRLQLQRRVILADADCPSNGRYLYQRAAAGGAQAIGRNSGILETGRLADLTAIDTNSPLMESRDPDAILDTWVFGVEERLVSNVWSAGRQVVRAGEHFAREDIASKFRKTIHRLRSNL